MGRNDQLSEVLDLTGQAECTSELIGRGGFGGVYKGRWIGEAVNAATRPPIAVKVISLPLPEDKRQEEKQFKNIKRELVLWSKIYHKNILPLLGTIQIDHNTNIPAFICPWMKNGNAKQFCLRNPFFSPLSILDDIIQGLHYLHSSNPEIVHGDIKAANVLINDRYEACLCDFGLSRFLINNTLWMTTATHAGGSLAWMSPELMTGEQCTPTKESDIYAYGMTCYEILSGDRPFKSVKKPFDLLCKVKDGERPKRDDSCYFDFIWDIITRCWAQRPKDRMSTKEVLELFRRRVATPSSVDVLDLSGQIECTSELIGRGGFGHVFKGRWVGETVNNNRPPIAVKVTMIPPLQDETQKKRQSKQIKRELVLWSKINHKNILPLLGVAYIDHNINVPALICPLMENGNAKLFRSRNPSFPHVLILYDIIQGLHYLHTFEPEIVHGDIKAVNVLINDRREACLCDFGLSRFRSEDKLWITTAEQANGTARWMSPELISGKASTPTKESDIYAYAMTCYEILSGDVPFKSVMNDTAVLYKIMKGQRPERIKSCHTDYVWDIITRCWAENHGDRPCAAKVLELVQPSRTGLEKREVVASSEGEETGTEKYLTALNTVPTSYYSARSMFTKVIQGCGMEELLAGSGERTMVEEMGELKTDWKSLSLKKVTEIEDKRTVAENLMEPIIRKDPGVRQVLKIENGWKEVGSLAIPASRTYLSIRKVLEDEGTKMECLEQPTSWQCLNISNVPENESQERKLGSLEKRTGRMYLSIRKVLDDGNESKSETTKVENPGKVTGQRC